ncbi:MAG TPA: DMT family transporter [Chloroflexota bacterium]|nr:DMT family transporter [Chloroflexota bacterium]
MSPPAPGTTRAPASPDLSPAPINPYFGLLAATIAVSFSAILIKDSHVPALVIAAYRMVITTLLLLPFLRRSHMARIRALDARSRLLTVLSGLLLALHFAFWTASLSYTSVASSVLFVSIHPALVAATGAVVLGERPSRRAVVGIILTLIGSAVIAGGDFRLGDHALLGDGLAALGAVVFAGYLVIGRGARQYLDNIAYSIPVYGLCAGFLAGLAVAFRQSLIAVGSRDLLDFLALAVVCTLGGHLLYNWTLRYLPAAAVSISFLGEPVGASLLAWLLLGQQPAATSAGGGAIVLAGIWLTIRS